MHRATIVGIAALCLVLGDKANAAEEEPILLTIEGDLIGAIDKLEESAAPAEIITAYYALLPAEVRRQAEGMGRALERLIPDYEVAYDAADSAEITEVRSDIFDVWARIRTLHAANFTIEASQHLDSAFRQAYAVILAEQ